MTTTTKAMLLGLILSVVPAVADAKVHGSYTPPPTHTIKVKTSQHIYCPYKGCKAKFH